MDDKQLHQTVVGIIGRLPDNTEDAMTIMTYCFASVTRATGASEETAIEKFRYALRQYDENEIETHQ